MDEKAGSGASPAVDADAPLVLLHGFGGSSRSWSQVTALLGDDIDVIAMDLPGHGGSLNAEGRGGAGRMARGVGGILSALNLDRYHLCGHSMGGAVAALLALRDPARVASLTLVAPGGLSPAINSRLLARYAAATTFEEIAECLSRMAAHGFRFPDTAIQHMVDQRARDGAPGALAEIFLAMFPNGIENGQGVLPMADLARLEMSVAVLWGTGDTVVPCPGIAALPANFALSLLPDLGHMLPEEAPAAIARVLVHAVKG